MDWFSNLMSLDASNIETTQPIEQPAPARQRRQNSQLRRFALYSQLAAIAIVVLIVGVFAAFQFAERGEVRSGVTAFGVDLGGMNRDEARRALNTARDQRNGQEIWLMDGTRGWEVTESDLGLAMDIEGAMDDAFAAGHDGFSPGRLALVWHFNGQTEVGVGRVRVDGSVLATRLAQLTTEINQEKIDPELMVHADGTHTYRNAQIGRAVNVNATSTNVLRSLATGSSAAAIAVDETPPVATDVAYEHARQQLHRVLDAPITMVAADREWTLTPDQIAYWLELIPANGDQPAEVKIDQGWVDAVIYEIGWATDRSPKTPRVWWDVGGALYVMQDGVNGQQMDSQASLSMVMDTFLGLNDTNRIEFPVATSPPLELPADLNELGIRSLIAESSTPYGGGNVPEKKHNIELAARLLNGTVVLPGQVFSFNAEIGAMTTDAGFQVAYGIANENGDLRTVPAEAGGICQVASTVFQPVFWAGYQIERRSTHSYWIPSYTSNGLPGLDATVDSTTGLDFRWMNNGPSAILIEAAADGDNFTVRLYGTQPDWTVDVSPPEITNVVAARQEEIMQDDSTLQAGQTLRVERAQDGFDIEIVRKVHESDGEVRELVLSAEYGPSRNVTLVGTGEDVAEPQASTP